MVQDAVFLRPEGVCGYVERAKKRQNDAKNAVLDGLHFFLQVVLCNIGCHRTITHYK